MSASFSNRTFYVTKLHKKPSQFLFRHVFFGSFEQILIPRRQKLDKPPCSFQEPVCACFQTKTVAEDKIENIL